MQEQDYNTFTRDALAHAGGEEYQIPCDLLNGRIRRELTHMLKQRGIEL